MSKLKIKFSDPTTQGSEYQESGQKVVKHEPSSCLRLVALILALNLGVLGAHRFYVGKIGSALLYIFTCGFFGLGILIDIVKIVKGTFKDYRGDKLVKWLE